MKALHTPGPWFVDEDEFSATVYVPKNGDHDDQREVAKVKILRIAEGHAREDIANAALIVAAPAMLARLEALADDVCSWKCPSTWKTADGQPHSDECKAHRALIAAAKERVSR